MDGDDTRSNAAANIQPFRAFFLLTALDAIAAVAVWVLPLPGIVRAELAGVQGVWHRQEFLFGMVPAMLAGFLLTALPRWTGRPTISRPALRAFCVLWVAARIVHGVAIAAGSLMSAAFIAGLTARVVRDVAACRDRRNLKVVVLLLVFLIAGLLAAARPSLISDEYGSRLSLAAILGLVIVIGGRVVPSLTAAYDCPSAPRTVSTKPWIEALAAVGATAGLATWVVYPAAAATALACSLALISQTLRLGQWQIWRAVAQPSVFVLHIGYAWIPVGFALAAAAAEYPELIASTAVVHAWTVGAVGLMSLGIMASMIRRQTGAAFHASNLLTAGYACVIMAAPARLLAEIPVGMHSFWMGVAGLCWICAYAIFLIVFARALLTGTPPRRQSTFAISRADA